MITTLLLLLPNIAFAALPVNDQSDLFNNQFLFALTLSIQTISLLAIAFAFKSIPHQSLKLFWRYFTFALSGALMAQLINGLWPIAQIITDFLSLFSYFFILLAIETNPHLSETPRNKYLGGRIPAVFYCLFCFVYFILLPYEFAPLTYQNLQPSALFHVLVSGLIFFRISLAFTCVLINSSHENNDSKLWFKLYGLLALGGLSLFVEKSLGMFVGAQAIDLKDSLVVSNQALLAKLPVIAPLLALLPFVLIAIAAMLTVGKPLNYSKHQPKTHTELYVFTSVFVILLIHFIGKEYQLFYVVSTPWQPFILLSSLFAALCFLLLLQHYKNKKFNLLKAQIASANLANEELTEINQELANSIVYSENKAIVYASNNAILTASVDGEILSANPAAVQVFQRLEQDFIGSNVRQLFHVDDNMFYFFDFKSNVYSLQRKETGISAECSAIRSDGSKFPAQLELQWADRQEQPLIVITFINLTARKLAEKQALELKDKFIANISHEFRTPLTIINGILDQYLARTNSSDESKELTTAKRNGLRLVRMVEQLLELSQLADDPRLAIARYKLEHLMTMPLDSFSRLAKQSQLSFHAEIADNLWLDCDAQAFDKIIFNLLANAIKYTPAGGSITVKAYQEDDAIVLDVIDTGIGIDKSSQARIFERFQRANDDKNKAIFGVGIGLSLVNELVNAHQWRIHLASEYNRGSKFTLNMPMAEPSIDEGTQDSQSAQANKTAIDDLTPVVSHTTEDEISSLLIEQQSQTSNIDNHSQQVVLVIEDNLDMQSHIKQVIEKAHHCILATSGEIGLTLAQEYMPDLIVCDIMLTGIDGFEVLKQLKKNDITAHIPVLLLTARSDLESRLQGLNLNADDYLSKPFNQQELLVRIASLIENRRQLQKSFQQHYAQQQVLDRKSTSHENLAQLTEPEQPTATLDEQFITRLEKSVAKMYIEPELGIAHLANELAMSERQLQRKIKVLLGTTPNNFIKEFRLKKAQVLLQSGSQIGRIAQDVGFSSQTYFGRCFKEAYGCTPKQYQSNFNAQHRS